MAKKKLIKSSKLPKPVKSKDLPATFGALDKVRSELKSDITSVKLEIKSVRTELKGEITTVRAEVSSVRSEVKSLRDEMNSKFEGMEAKFDAKFEEIKSTNQRMLALLEEQNSRNRAALDGYTAVHDAQLRLEDRVDKIEANQFDIAKLLKSKEV